MKRVTKEELFSLVDDFGDTVIDPVSLKKRIDQLFEQPAYKVTPAELEVLHLWADGYTTHYIACLRGVSLRTVERQIGSLNREFGTNNRGDLVAKAREAGIIL